MTELTHKERRALTVEQRRAIAKQLRYAAKQALKSLERAWARTKAAEPCTCRGDNGRWKKDGDKKVFTPGGHKRGPTCPARKGGESWVKVHAPRPVKSTLEKLRERR